MNDGLTMVVIAGVAVLFFMMPMIRMRLAGVGSVPPAALKARLDAGENLLVLDVRTKGEFAEGHLARIRHVPLDQLGARMAELRLNHDGQGVVVVCRAGPRAAVAGRMLKGAGFADVSILSGGMMGWARAGFPITR